MFGCLALWRMSTSFTKERRALWSIVSDLSILTCMRQLLSTRPVLHS